MSPSSATRFTQDRNIPKTAFQQAVRSYRFEIADYRRHWSVTHPKWLSSQVAERKPSLTSVVSYRLAFHRIATDVAPQKVDSSEIFGKWTLDAPPEDLLKQRQ